MTLPELIALIFALFAACRAALISTRPPVTLRPVAPIIDDDEAEELAGWLRHREAQRRPYGAL